MMTRDQFRAALDRYGGDLSRWPAGLRHEAEALIASDADAAAAIATARRLDSLLAEVTRPSPVHAALIGRLTSHATVHHGETVLMPSRRLIGWASAAMVATLIIGFVAGLVIPADQSDDAFAALLFGGTETDVGGELL